MGQGRVDWYSAAIGYGFIVPFDGGDRVFVQHRGIAANGHKALENGANLEALNERPRPGGQRKLSGKQEAQLIAVACTPAPTGQPHWTLRLLADKVVELGFADSIARETVRQVLKKTRSSPGSTSSGVCRR